MPLIIEGGRVPNRWAERHTSRPAVSAENSVLRGCIRLALINNMPDPALEDTELQFFELLDVASGDVPVALKLYSLTGIPRTDRGERHLNTFYFAFEDLWNSNFDGVIVTGTEPRQPDLRDEPYWATLTQVFDWAEECTHSTVLSCLAAHASVLHCDGINRHRLPDKQFGVFNSVKKCEHRITNDIAGPIRFPHSRWNEVRAGDLSASGYSILTESPTAGVDVFARKRKKSMFVHFQGHPEYGAQTLLKEYRRDVKRFLREERETYPTMPAGYFDADATRVLNDFREIALGDRREQLAESFPDSVVGNGLQHSWRSSAISVYRNWLQLLESHKKEALVLAPAAVLHNNTHRKPSVAS
jgi:homoserine O-succinyltransferase